MPDGSPIWLPQVERWLVGGAMLSKPEDVQTAAATCTSDDFLDRALAPLWDVLPYLECPCWLHASEALNDSDLDALGGEPGLVELAYTHNSYLYANKVGLEAHAGMVHEWGEKRRKLQALSQEAAAVYEGRPSNVTPIYQRPEYVAVGF